MPPIGVDLLMKVVFNLVKCCRDQAFDICMDGIALQWRMGIIDLESPLFYSPFTEGFLCRRTGHLAGSECEHKEDTPAPRCFS